MKRTVVAVMLLAAAACSRGAASGSQAAAPAQAPIPTAAPAAPAAPPPVAAIPAASPAPAPAASATSGPGSAGVVGRGRTIRAFGTEPFWSLDVRADSATYTDFSTASPRPETLQDVRIAAGSETTVRGRLADGRSVTLSLTRAECSEVGETSSPMTARLTVGDATREGCAGPIAGDGFR